MKTISTLRKMRQQISKQIKSAEQVLKMSESTDIKNNMLHMKLIDVVWSLEKALAQVETEIRYKSEEV